MLPGCDLISPSRYSVVRFRMNTGEYYVGLSALVSNLFCIRNILMAQLEGEKEEREGERGEREGERGGGRRRRREGGKS